MKATRLLLRMGLPAAPLRRVCRRELWSAAICSRTASKFFHIIYTSQKDQTVIKAVKVVLRCFWASDQSSRERIATSARVRPTACRTFEFLVQIAVSSA